MAGDEAESAEALLAEQKDRKKSKSKDGGSDSDKKKKKKKKKLSDVDGTPKKSKKDRDRGRRVKGTTIARPTGAPKPLLTRTNSAGEVEMDPHKEKGAFAELMGMRNKQRSGTIDQGGGLQPHTGSKKAARKSRMGFHSVRLPKKNTVNRGGLDTLFSDSAGDSDAADSVSGLSPRGAVTPSGLSRAASQASTGTMSGGGGMQTTSNVAFQALYRKKMAEKKQRERQMFPISDDMPERNVKRNKVLNECINTERDYIRDLEVMIKYFRTPLVEQGLITKADASNMFSNVNLLVDVNKALYKGLFEAAKEAKGGDNAKIGDCFMEMSAYLKMYSMYCGNQSNSRQVLNNLLATNPKVKQFVERQTAEEAEVRKLSLKDYLIKPIQRLCKYPLLLREAIKYTDEDNADYGKLKKAYTLIEGVVASVEESKRHEEDIEAMSRVVGSFDNADEFGIKMMVPKRRFIVTSGVKSLVPEDESDTPVEVFFLFNDMLILSAAGVTKKKAKSDTFTIKNVWAFANCTVAEDDGAVAITAGGVSYTLRLEKNRFRTMIVDAFAEYEARPDDSGGVETFERKAKN